MLSIIGFIDCTCRVSLGSLFSHFRPRDIRQEIVPLSILKLFIHIQVTIWKFESKNSQEYYHMVWNGTTNHPSLRDHVPAQYTWKKNLFGSFAWYLWRWCIKHGRSCLTTFSIMHQQDSIFVFLANFARFGNVVEHSLGCLIFLRSKMESKPDGK